MLAVRFISVNCLIVCLEGSHSTRTIRGLGRRNVVRKGYLLGLHCTCNYFGQSIRKGLPVHNGIGLIFTSAIEILVTVCGLVGFRVIPGHRVLIYVLDLCSTVTTYTGSYSHHPSNLSRRDRRPSQMGGAVIL
ncbi:hypothetical protein EDB86DRAFT_1646778 [Lactarius hatsudake]|nr:hypothetical protein EDB86DRAFT_1646778 [Lactarius hatsudake]